MKKLTLLLISLILISTIAYANELTGSTLEIQEKPSSTPGKFTWGIQRALERIKLALTFGSENKAAYGLQIAERRLAEIQQLAALNNTSNIETAKEEYQKQIEQVKQQIELLKDSNNEKELQKLTIIEQRLLQFEDKIQRLQSFIDTKTNLTEDQQEKLNNILDQLKEKDEELKEKLAERENKTLERFNLTKDELQKKVEEIKAQYNITQIKQELIQHDIERLKAKEENLREIASKSEEKGKNASILLTRLDVVNTNLQQIQSSNLSIEDQKELLRETQQLLNFRQVYRNNNTKDIEEVKQNIKEKIQEKIKERQDIIGNIKGKLKEIKQEIRNRNVTAGIANPASVYCEQHEGTLEIRTNSDGSQTGYCKFSNGSECEEWAYYRGECKPGTKENETKSECELISGYCQSRVVGYGCKTGFNFNDNYKCSNSDMFICCAPLENNNNSI